jgi:DNA-binding response OmpR family regulator
MTVLLIEDNAQISEIICAYLEREGLTVEVCATGKAGLVALRERHVDLVVLDIGLPDLDGYSVCRELRKTSDVPVLMLSARDDPLDRILGLEVGADDFVTKPFHPPELLLRLRGLLRRTESDQEHPLFHGELCLEPASRRASYSGKPLQLTRTEFDLLLTFVRHPGQILSREQLIGRVWADGASPEPRIVDSHLRNLRSKLRDASPNAELIRSIRGVGYRLD